MYVEFSEAVYHKFMYKSGMKWFYMLTMMSTVFV